MLPANPDLCAPATITFAYPPSVLTGNGPGTSYTYIVQTGCELPDTTIIPHTSPFTPFTHTFLRSSCDPMCTVPGASPGSFRVIMVATNSCGTTRDTMEVRTASPGTLGFTAPTVVYANDLVCLADNSSPGYAWNATTQMCGNAKYWEIMPNTFNLVSGNLGNAGNPGSSNPCIRFTQAGTYMVFLIRPAGACPADTLKKVIIVKPPCDSLANFTSNATCNSVTFTPAFIDPNANYTWNFGDGSSSNEISPSHIYLTQNNTQYTVVLTVVDTVGSANCTDSHTAIVTVIIPASGMPMASMMSFGVALKDDFLHCNASNSNLPTSDDFNLNVQNTSLGVIPGTTYNINWGDTTPPSMPISFGTTSHLYTSMGLFDIVLSAINPNGCVDTAQYKFFNGREPAVGIGIPPSADLCAPETIIFENTPGVITGNPPGTTYTYVVITGCDTITSVIQHSNPFIPFAYTFLRGSCEPDCILPNNPGQFIVTMVSTNECGTQSGSVTPRISKIGQTDFEMVEQACVSDSVCILNMSETSYYWTANQGGSCSTEMLNFWKIDPPTGFSIQSGTLGDFDLAIVGTEDICLRFNMPGSYTVQLASIPPPATISSPCPGDTITKTICILPQPIANFTFPLPAPPCAPNNSTITFINSSNTLTSCRPATYTWEVEFIDSECGDMGGYTFLNNTNPNSINPRIRFDSSGRYLIKLIVENDCGIDSTTREVIFGGTPFATIVPINDTCGTLMFTPTVQSTNSCNGMLPNFQWIIQNPLMPAIFDTLMINEIPDQLNYNNPGTYIIRLIAIGVCGNSTTSETFTVHSIPAPPQITSNTPVCQGQCLNINVQNPINNFEYVWETPCDPPGTVNTANVLICPADPSCTGLYQLTITDPSSTLRCSLIVNTSALVYDAPPFDLQPDTLRICLGQSDALQVNGQLSYTYVWLPGNLTGPIIPVTPTMAGTLTYTVIVTDALACTNSATAVVIVHPLPVLAIDPSATACENIDLPLSATVNQPGTGMWTSDPPGPMFFTPTSNPTLFQMAPQGTYSIKYEFRDTNGCRDSAFTSVCVQPQPIAQFTASPLSGCISPMSPTLQVSTNNISNTLSTCGITTYNWEVFFDGAECHNGTGIWNFEMGSSANSVDPVINFGQSGVYRLVLTVDNECGTASTETTVTVGEAPKGLSIDLIDDACDNLFLMPTGQALACNAPGLSLTWLLDDIPFLNPPGTSEVVDGLHTVTMVATNFCGSNTFNSTFTIHPLPPAPVMSYNGPRCERDTLVLTVNSPTGANLQYQYCWARPNGLPDTCVTDPVLKIYNATTLNAGTYTVTVTNQSTMPACSSSASITVVVNQAPKITFQADTVRICSGQSGTLQVTENGYNPYNWSPTVFLNPPTGIGQVVTVMPKSVTTPDTLYYTVTVQNNLTCTNAATAVVIVNPLPVLAVALPDTACAGQPLPLFDTNNQTGTWLWMSNPAGPMFGTPTTNPTTFTGTPGTYWVKYVFIDTNMCSDSAFTNVCVQPLPISQFTASPLTGCISSVSPSLQVSTNNSSNTQNTCGTTTYNWAVFFDGAECHNGAGIWNFESGSSDTSLNPVINFGQSGVYRLVLTVENECGTSSTETTVTVGEAPQGLAIDSIGNACDTLFLVPTGQALACNAPGLTLTWFLDNTFPPFPNPPGIGVGVDGQHTVTLVATNVCGSDTLSTNFTIHPLPPVPVVTYNGPLCERDSLVFTVSSPIGPDFEYCWIGPNGLDTCVTDSFLIIPNATPANAGLYTVTVRDLSTMPACSASATIAVVVNAAPPIIFQADTVRICSGQSGIIQVINGQPSYTYLWVPDTLVDTTVGPLVTVTPGTVPAPLTLFYTVTVTDTLTCTNSATAVVIVNPLPVLAIAPPDTACAGVQLPLSATVSQLGVGVWTSDPAGPVFDTTTSNPSFFLTSDTGTYTIRYVFTDINGCIDSAFTSICVQPQPIAQFDISQSSNCISSMSPTLQVTTNNTSNTQHTCGITTYNWQILFDTSECDSGPGIWNFEPGSSDTSLNPVINFGQSGVYRLVLTVTNECGSSSDTATVTVGEAPQVQTINPINNACDALFLMPTGQVLACNAPGLNLTWYLDSVQFLNPPGILVTLDGQHTVQLVATNICGADTLATSFTIHPLPPTPMVSSNGPVCERDDLIFTVSSPIGPDFEYCWMGPNGLNTCVKNPVLSLINVTPANAGLYTVTVRDLSTVPACTASATIMAVVNPAPPITFQADTVRICSGQSDTIRVNQAGYNPYIWSPTTFLSPPTGQVVTVTPDPVPTPTTLLYTVTVTNNLTCTNFATAVVIVNPLPVLAIAPPDTACAGQPLPLFDTNNQTGTWLWTSDPLGPIFGTSTSNPTTFTGTPGTYLVKYVFIDTNLCSDSAFTSVCVQPQPIAQFTVPSTGCITQSSPVFQVTTNNTSNTLNTCGTTSYLWEVFFEGAECHNGAGIWNFEPGSSATSVNPVINFGQSGVYRLVLTVSNECGTSSTTATVTVGEAPQITSFATTPPVVCEPYILNPSATVLGCNSPTTYLWSFAGSSGIQSDTVLNPGPIPYNVPGLYTVWLVAKNACGQDSAAHTFRVRALPSITATASNTTGCVPVVATFSNQPVAGVTYVWDFGDGSSPVTTPNPGSHTYNNPGTYTITITATDAFGCSRTSTLAIVQANPVPTAGFTLAPTLTCGIPQTLCLTNNAVGNLTYTWTFVPNIGPIAPIANPCVSITAEGDYVIQQLVRNQFGCVDSTTLTYTAYDQPVASFEAVGDSSGCEDLLIQFNNQSLHADFVEWQIDGRVVTLDPLNPSYLFTDPGEYTVTLTVGNGSGCTASLTRNAYIRVFPTPVAGFEFVPLPNEWPVTFRFRDKSSPDAILFGWNFGETTIVDSEGKNPKYRYFSTADRLITHWVTNAFGCSDTITAPLSIDVDGDLFIPNILEPANNDHAEKQIFLPKGYNLAEYHIAVFARTGQLIWESTLLDANGYPVESWDGTLNGSPLPSGVFVWKVNKAVFINGREWNGMLDENKVKRKTNFLYLIR
jgi:PKD repeat protein